MLRTILCAISVRGKGNATTRASTSPILFYRSMATIPRTVFYLTMCSLSRIERDTTMGASASTTIITYGGCTRSGHELFAAIPTLLNGHGNGEGRHGDKLRMGSPEFLFRNAVACFTEGDQIVQPVGLSVIIKEAKRADVVDRMTRSNCSAMLAGIVVPITRCRSLLMPVGPTIATMPTKPSGIVFARPIERLAPFCKAFSIAKVMLIYGAWLLFNSITAGVTHDDYAIAPNTNLVRFLPLAITGKTAEVILRFGSHVWLGFVDFSALFTR